MSDRVCTCIWCRYLRVFGVDDCVESSTPKTPLGAGSFTHRYTYIPSRSCILFLSGSWCVRCLLITEIPKTPVTIGTKFRSLYVHTLSLSLRLFGTHQDLNPTPKLCAYYSGFIIVGSYSCFKSGRSLVTSMPMQSYVLLCDAQYCALEREWVKEIQSVRYDVTRDMWLTHW